MLFFLQQTHTQSIILPLQNKDDFSTGFVDLMQLHHIRVCLGQLQHGDLIQDVHTTVRTLPSFSQELGSILLSRCLLNTLLYHCKLTPGEHKWGRERKRT